MNDARPQGVLLFDLQALVITLPLLRQPWPQVGHRWIAESFLGILLPELCLPDPQPKPFSLDIMHINELTRLIERGRF